MVLPLGGFLFDLCIHCSGGVIAVITVISGVDTDEANESFSIDPSLWNCKQKKVCLQAQL